MVASHSSVTRLARFARSPRGHFIISVGNCSCAESSRLKVAAAKRRVRFPSTGLPVGHDGAVVTVDGRANNLHCAKIVGGLLRGGARQNFIKLEVSRLLIVVVVVVVVVVVIVVAVMAESLLLVILGVTWIWNNTGDRVVYFPALPGHQQTPTPLFTFASRWRIT